MARFAGVRLSYERIGLSGAGNVKLLFGGDLRAMVEVGHFLYILGHYETTRKKIYSAAHNQFSIGVLDLRKMRWKWLPAAKFRLPILLLHDDAVYMCDLKTWGAPKRMDVARLDLALEEWSIVHTTGEVPMKTSNWLSSCGDYLEALKSFVVFGGGSREHAVDNVVHVLVVQDEIWLEANVKGKGPMPTELKRSSCVHGDSIYYYSLDGFFVLRLSSADSGVWSSIQPRGETMVSRIHLATLIPFRHKLLFCRYDSSRLGAYDPRTQRFEVVDSDYKMEISKNALTFPIENRTALGHFRPFKDAYGYKEIGYLHRSTVA